MKKSYIIAVLIIIGLPLIYGLLFSCCYTIENLEIVDSDILYDDGLVNIDGKNRKAYWTNQIFINLKYRNWILDVVGNGMGLNVLRTCTIPGYYAIDIILCHRVRYYEDYTGTIVKLRS